MLRFRNAASSSSVMAKASRPSNSTSPPVGGSSVPITCRNVLFPTPLGPTSDAISPPSSEKLAPRRTWISFSPSQYDLCTCRASTRGAKSFLPQPVHRRESAGLGRGIQRRQVAERQGDRGHHHELPAIHVHRQIRDVIDVGVELEPELLDEGAGSEPQEKAHRRADGADGEPLHHEDLHHARGARPASTSANFSSSPTTLSPMRKNFCASGTPM